MNTETISPPSSLKDQSLNSFSHNLTGRLGVNLGTETVIHETKNVNGSPDEAEINSRNAHCGNSKVISIRD